MENKKEIGGVQEKEPLTKEQARDEIMFIRQQVYLMAANDSELPEINRILEELEANKIDPNDAVEKVYQIKNSKQDYH